MKHRICYSKTEQLYKVETKHFLGRWETRKNYLYTTPDGNIISAKGFFTVEKAREWVYDRYPQLNYFIDSQKNKNMNFGF